jgi:FkbH-like protein
VSSADGESQRKRRDGGRKIKVVVWDLDNTIWDGVLLEDRVVTLRRGIVDVIDELDRRGILQSVASKNEHDVAMAKLEEFGLAAYFLSPQIHWGAKSGSIRRLAEILNLGLDSFAFIDDQIFERDEVASELSEVLCLDAAVAGELTARPEFMPRFVTEESRQRRQIYELDMRRQRAEESFEGPKEEFLASLGLEFGIAQAAPGDLERVEELTVRTNQLNATGYTYSYEELEAFRASPDHLLLVAQLEDRYGTYGKIGVALLEQGGDAWTIKLLLMSCRVMARGVGSVLLAHVMRRAQKAGVRLLAEFIPNGRNRQMQITFRFSGFREKERRDGVVVLEADLQREVTYPRYVTVRASDAHAESLAAG